MIEKWDKRFLRIAKEVSTWSKDPRWQVGAVAVLDRRILATGFNGFPRGVEDHEWRWTTRELKQQHIVHAEMNCIYNAAYNGISLVDSTMYVFGLPVCLECGKGIVQAGITKVIGCASLEDGIPDRWMESYKKTVAMLDETGVQFKLCDVMTLLEEH